MYAIKTANYYFDGTGWSLHASNARIFVTMDEARHFISDTLGGDVYVAYLV